jgi:hypothetical protein
MTLEDRLSEAIDHVAGSVGDPPGAQIPRAVARGRVRRRVRQALVALGVALLIAGVTAPLVLLARLQPPVRPVTGPTPSPTPSPSEPSLSPPEGAGPFHPKTYREGGSVVMPVTFPDGTTAEVIYPEELGTASIGSFAYLEGVPEVCHPEVKPVREGIVCSWSRPGPPLAVFEGAHGEPVGFWDGMRWAEPWDVLAFDFGAWVAVIGCQADPVEDADALALVARSLDAREAEDGFLILEPRSPLRLVRTGEPRILFSQDVPGRDLTLVRLTIKGCPPSGIELGGGTAQGCLDGGIWVYALGDREFLNQVAAGLQVRNVKEPPGWPSPG